MPLYEKTDQGAQALIPGCERREKRRAGINDPGPLFAFAEATCPKARTSTPATRAESPSTSEDRTRPAHPSGCAVACDPARRRAKAMRIWESYDLTHAVVISKRINGQMVGREVPHAMARAAPELLAALLAVKPFIAYMQIHDRDRMTVAEVNACDDAVKATLAAIAAARDNTPNQSERESDQPCP